MDSNLIHILSLLGMKGNVSGLIIIFDCQSQLIKQTTEYMPVINIFVNIIIIISPG